MTDLGHIITQGEGLSMVRSFSEKIQIQTEAPEFLLIFSQIFCTDCTQKWKTIKRGEIKRQYDGCIESVILNFKHLDQGCISGKIYFAYFLAQPLTEGMYMCSQALFGFSVMHDILLLNKV